MKKRLIYVLVSAVIGVGVWGAFEAGSSYAQQQAVNKTNAAKSVNVSANKSSASADVVSVKPLEVVANPQAYLNKNIKMEATFDKFSTLGLDYTPALKKSEDYIGILIRRDDVTEHVMPLAEMKLFLARKTAEKYIDLESGDKISIEGYVFSTALSDPWIEIKKLTVISSKKPIKAS